MKKCVMEIMFSLKKNNGMMIFLLVLCALCFGGGKVLYSYMKSMERVEDRYEKAYFEEYIYQIADVFDGGYEDYFKPENYEKLAQWNEVLHASNVLTFVEVNKQYFTKHEGWENEHHDGLYIGKNYFEEFPPELQVGRLFEEEDFIYEEGKCMPIILGASYEQEFELGEHFLADTVFMQTEVCVIGFLKKGELAYFYGTMKTADDYIFFPMLDFPDKQNIETANSRLMYMKNSGVVKTRMSKTETQDYLYDISDSLGMPGVFIIPGSMNQRIPGMAISMEKIMQTSRMMLIFLCVITVLFLIFYISRKMKKNWNYYSVLYLLGFTRKEVFSIMLGDMLLLLVVANVLAELCFVAWRVFTGAVAVGFWFNVAGSALLLFVPFLFSVWSFKRKDLCSRLAEEGSYL